jgi:hypothetical protein
MCRQFIHPDFGRKCATAIVLIVMAAVMRDVDAPRSFLAKVPFDMYLIVHSSGMK